MKYFWIVGSFAATIATGLAAEETKTLAEKERNLFDIASDRSCIAGHNPFAENTTSRVRGLAEATLAKYIALAGSGAGVDARAAYTTKTKTFGTRTDFRFGKVPITLRWRTDGVVGDPVRVDDPLARRLVAMGVPVSAALKPESFFIAGAKFNAMGTWRVAAPGSPGQTLGWYTAQFMRENSLGSQSWTLMSLDVSSESAAPPPIRQFCFEPGDVEVYLAKVQKGEAERQAKKALKRK